MRRIDKTGKTFGEPVVAPRLLALSVHPLLHDGPVAVVGHDKAVQVELEPVLHRRAIVSVAAGLIEMRAADLVAEGFGRDCAELVAMARDFRALHAEPERRDLAWRYGIGPEIVDPVRRTAEIGNWLREAAKISSS